MAEPEDWLVQRMADVLRKCLDTGMQVPLTVTAIAANGSLVAYRFDGTGDEPELIAESDADDFMIAPINIVFCDPKGEAARLLIIGPDKRAKLQLIH